VFYALLALALIYDFLNGFHDSANLVATAIYSRSIHPRLALLLAAASEFAGPFLFGVAVATTIGHELLDERVLQTPVIIAALGAAVIWNLITWLLGIPSSSSHALLGGLLGAAIAFSRGVAIVRMPGLLHVILALLLSPLAGMITSFFIMKGMLRLLRNATPRASVVFRRLQILTLIGLGLSHGSNDAQKTMGIIALGLLVTGRTQQFTVPVWVIAISAGAIALGTSLGGWRLIRTLGGRIFRVRPIHGFTSQVSGAGVILGAALLGGPVSTTQVLSSAIVGVGAAERINKVRWNILGEMVLAWLLTIPLTALLAGLIFLILDLALPLG